MGSRHELCGADRKKSGANDDAQLNGTSEVAQLRMFLRGECNAFFVLYSVILHPLHDSQMNNYARCISCKLEAGELIPAS